METGNVEIDDYLLRLERASQGLPAGRRVELLAEIRAHIDEARRTESLNGEAGVRALLERLGPPEEIVAAEDAAADGDRPADRTALKESTAPKESTALEIWAVLMLSVGSILLPVIGWLIGVVLLWSSRRWRIGEKLLGTLVVPGGLGSLLILGVIGLGSAPQGCFVTATPTGTGTTSTTDTCSGAADLGLLDRLMPAGFVIVALAALIVPFYLLHTARKRTARDS